MLFIRVSIFRRFTFTSIITSTNFKYTINFVFKYITDWIFLISANKYNFNLYCNIYFFNVYLLVTCCFGKKKLVIIFLFAESLKLIPVLMFFKQNKEKILLNQSQLCIKISQTNSVMLYVIIHLPLLPF